MNAYMALFLFSIIILVYWVITELFTILFRFTGLPDERARFQVISLLTGCGRGIRPSGGEEDLKPVIYLYPLSRLLHTQAALSGASSCSAFSV